MYLGVRFAFCFSLKVITIRGFQCSFISWILYKIWVMIWNRYSSQISLTTQLVCKWHVIRLKLIYSFHFQIEPTTLWLAQKFCPDSSRCRPIRTLRSESVPFPAFAESSMPPRLPERLARRLAFNFSPVWMSVKLSNKLSITSCRSRLFDNWPVWFRRSNSTIRWPSSCEMKSFCRN